MSVLLFKNILTSIFLCSVLILPCFSGNIHTLPVLWLSFPRSDILPFKNIYHFNQPVKGGQGSNLKEPQPDESIPLTASDTPEADLNRTLDTNRGRKFTFTLWGSQTFSEDFLFTGHRLKGFTDMSVSTASNKNDLVAVNNSLWRVCEDNNKYYCLSSFNLPDHLQIMTKKQLPPVLFELKTDDEIINKKDTVVLTFHGGHINKLIIACGITIRSKDTPLKMDSVYIRSCKGDKSKDKETKEAKESSSTGNSQQPPDNNGASSQTLDNGAGNSGRDDDDGGDSNKPSENPVPSGHYVENNEGTRGIWERLEIKKIMYDTKNERTINMQKSMERLT